jgi:hypothetical protein
VQVLRCNLRNPLTFADVATIEDERDISPVEVRHLRMTEDLAMLDYNSIHTLFTKGILLSDQLTLHGISDLDFGVFHSQ